jgi:NADH-quinone oxidoreductase subunit L
MGGLKKHMPITHATYLFACIAIAGFPIANGFYSKDEILWKAFSSEHLTLFGAPTPWLGPLIYVAGILAATGTSFYMFRSYYMTFTGTYRGGEGHGHEHGEDPHAAVAAPHHAAESGHHDAHVDPDPPVVHAPHAHQAHAPAHVAHAVHAADAHGVHHGGTPHESPRTMTFVLATLAIGSFATLFLGIPMAWTHQAPLLEQWLHPVLVAEVPFAEKAHVLEYIAQAVGVGAGFIGWIFARMLYKDAKSAVPARLKASFEGAWTVVYNKYYVDELYDLVVIRPSLAIGGFFSFFDGKVVDRLVELVGAAARGVANIDDAIDKYLVDGAVNALANATLDSGRALRRIQTGRIQTYLYGALAGGLAIIVLNFIVG